MEGRVMIFGHHINTDIIIPSQYLEYKDPEKYSKFVMSGIDSACYDQIQTLGDVIFVAGTDFGSGSSREQAPEAIKHAGVKLVIAESFASIFYRNAINVGLPIIEAPEILNRVKQNDILNINLYSGLIINQSQQIEIKVKALESFLLNKLEKGGLIPELQEYVKAHGLD
ncbi:MAG: 3-isopropylmalate dehydratase [Candidatus Heimdallarchaeota archaeon]|nr:3-isopropylmalate dehydratase [Candidatus Heimdallarchaeota archaeon]